MLRGALRVSRKESRAPPRLLNRVRTQKKKSLLSNPALASGTSQLASGRGARLKQPPQLQPTGRRPWGSEGLRGGQVTLENSKIISSFHREG